MRVKLVEVNLRIVPWKKDVRLTIPFLYSIVILVHSQYFLSSPVMFSEVEGWLFQIYETHRYPRP